MKRIFPSKAKKREEKKKLKRPKKFLRENGRKNSNTGFEKRKILFLARASLTATQVHTPDTPEITTPFVSVETSMVSSRGLATTDESEIQEVNPPKNVAPPPTASTAE